MAVKKKRRFYVVDMQGDQIAVNPVNFNGKYVYERKLSEGQYFFRKKYSSKVEFTNTNGSNDFSYFADREYFDNTRCNEYTFIVEVLCDQSEWTQEFSGVFSTGQGFFDRDNCRFTVNVEPKDEYTCLLSSAKQQFNILDVETKVTAQVSIDSNYEFYVCRDSAPITGSNLTDCLDLRPLPEDSWKLFFQTTQSIISPPPHDYIMVWIRERAVVPCTGTTPVEPSGTGWVLDVDDCAGSGNAIYVRQPIQDWEPLNNPEVAYGDCPSSEPPQTVTKTVTLVNTPSDLTVDDIIGPDFLRYTVGPDTTSYWLYFPTNSSVVWSIDNDGSGAVVSTSNPSVNEFEVTYDHALTTDATFDVVCEETTPCGDVIEHRKTVTIRGSVSFITGNNTYRVVGPRCLCINQGDQVYEIPEEYRGCINSVTWIVNTLYVELISSTIYTATVRPKALTPLGSSNYNLISAVITNCENDFVPNVVVSGHVRTAIYTDRIVGTNEACVNSQGLKFSVPARTGASYTWNVTGGSITAGSGTNEITVTAGASTGDMVVTCKEDTDCGCTWTLVDDCTDGNPPIYWCSSSNAISYGGAVLLKDAIDYIIDQIACDEITGITSDFFEINPTGTAPGYVSGENYVTGETNQYDQLVLVQKSDARDPNASNPASVGKTTFATIARWLVEMFQVYWIIENGKVRFEHISYFEQPLGLDLTQSRFSDEMLKTNRYTFNNKERPKYERFEFAEAANTDFIGDDIWYNTMCVNQDPDSNTLIHSVPEITTDIEFVLRSPEDIGKDGFVMLATTVSGSIYTTIEDDGLLSLNPIANAPLSWANLHHHFFRHDRFWKSGFLNGNFVSFETSKNTVIQDAVELKFCCEFINWNPEQSIRTGLSDKWFAGIYGSTEKAEYDISKETLKLTIGYPR